jgi:hypothetical protein
VAETLQERQEAARVLEQVVATYAELVKDSLDHNAADHTTLEQSFDALTHVFRHWNPEHEFPNLSIVEQWEKERAASKKNLAAARERAALNAELAQIKERFVRLRRMHWFGLAFWCLRRYRATERGEWLAALNKVGSYLGGIDELTLAFSDALAYEWEHHGPWSNWILHELPSRDAHMVSPDGDFFDTFVLLTLRAIPTDAPEIDLPVDRRLATELRVEDPRQRVNRVLEDARLAAALPDDAQARADPLVGALSRMLERVQVDEEEATMRASLDRELVVEFIDTLESKWRSGRLFRAVFGYGQRVRRHESEPAPENAREVLRLWTNKRLFLPADLRVYGHTWQAEDFARELLRRENEKVVELLRAAPLSNEANESIAELVRNEIEYMHGRGYDQLVILVPRYWQLIPELGLEFSEKYGGSAQPPRWLPNDSVDDFRGEIGACPVLQVFQLPKDRIHVVDFSKWASWEEWLMGDGGLDVTIDVFDEAEAAERASSAPEERDRDEIARNIRLSALITTEIAFTVAVDDASAARSVPIPLEIQEREL